MNHMMSPHRELVAALMIGTYGFVGAWNEPNWGILLFALLPLGILFGVRAASLVSFCAASLLGLFCAFVFTKAALFPVYQAPNWFLANFALVSAYWLTVAAFLAASLKGASCRQSNRAASII